MVVNILVQIYAQDILNERLEGLKLKKFPNLHQSTKTALLDFDFASFQQPLANDVKHFFSKEPIWEFLAS